MPSFNYQPQTVLHSNADTVDEDEGSNGIEINEIPNLKFGDKVRHVRDGVDAPVRLVKLLLNPIRTQLSCTMQCTEGEKFQTMKDFSKIDPDEEVAVIISTADDCIKQCAKMEQEKLQRLMHPKELYHKQEDWLRRHERLNHVTHAQIRHLSKNGALSK